MHERVAERLRNNRRKHPPTTSVVIRPAASSSHLLLIVIVLIIILPFSRLLVSFGSLALGPPPRLGLGFGRGRRLHLLCCSSGGSCTGVHLGAG